VLHDGGGREVVGSEKVVDKIDATDAVLNQGILGFEKDKAALRHEGRH